MSTPNNLACPRRGRSGSLAGTDQTTSSLGQQSASDDTKRTIIKDKVIMEAQQARVALDPNRLPVGIEVDGALALARIALDN